MNLLFLFAPFLVAIILMMAAILRLRRAIKIAGFQAVKVTTATRMSALLSGLLMVGLSIFVLVRIAPLPWLQVAAAAGLAGGLEQFSLAASRGRQWLIWQNRAFAGVFSILAILIVAAELV